MTRPPPSVLLSDIIDKYIIFFFLFLCDSISLRPTPHTSPYIHIIFREHGGQEGGNDRVDKQNGG